MRATSLASGAARLDGASWAQLTRAFTDALEADGRIERPDLGAKIADGLADAESSGLVWVGDQVVGALVGVTRPDGMARIDTLALVPAARGRGLSEPIIAAWTAARGDHEARFETADGPLDAMLPRLGYHRHRAVHSLRAALRHTPVVGEPTPWPGHDAPMHRDDWTLRTAPRVKVARRDGTVVAWRDGRLLGLAGDLSPRSVRRAIALLPPGDAQCVDVPEGAALDALEAAGWIRFVTRSEWRRPATRR